MLQPLGSNVLIKVIPMEAKTASGLILLKDNTTMHRGEVIASGHGRTEAGVLVKNTLKPGDKVVFSKYAQYPEIELDGVKHFVIMEMAILAVEKE